MNESDFTDPIDLYYSNRRARREIPEPAERRRIREDAGLSIEEVARAMGTSRQAVHRWEQGVCTPRGDRAALYRDVLKYLRDLKP